VNRSALALALGLGSAGAAYLAMFGALYVLTYFLAARHIPVALAGLQLAALPLALGFVAPVAGRLAGRFAASTGGRLAGKLTAGGLLLAALGLLELAAFHSLAGRLAGLVLTGAGLGAFIPVNNADVMSAAPRERSGALSGVLNTARSLATALGVALAGLLYASGGLTVALSALAAIALTAAALAARVNWARTRSGASVASCVGRSHDPSQTARSGWGPADDRPQLPTFGSVGGNTEPVLVYTA
jgi:MFS family permease